MNNRDLDNLLKSAPVPERPAAYWDGFPKRVSTGLHWQSARAVREPAPRAFGRRPLAWGFGLATACVLLGFAAGFWRGHVAAQNQAQMKQADRFYREIASMFPNQVKAIVFEQQGPRLVLSDQPDVPVSPPVYLKICSAGDCGQFVTFSGQEVQFKGQAYEVLADARGHVLVVGRDQVWSETKSSDSVRVAAHMLSDGM